jgi:hypothetical protein
MSEGVPGRDRGGTVRHPIKDQRVGYDMFSEMVANSSHLWTVNSPSRVSQSRVLPSREQMIEDYMSIPTYTPQIINGHSVLGEPCYPSRAEAERAVGHDGRPEEAAA